MPPQLVDDLPVVNDAALRTFEEIGACQYQSSRMGRTRGQDDPSCECTLRRGAAYACTEESGCINRLTQVECVAGVCECGKYCQNQRFQKCAYAPVDIVQTPKKGFGLRAAAALPIDAFVYEYIGEVVNHATFLRRMEQYKAEQIEHFYFMMLQRDEYIDATKRGARSRFINHSCNPNCYVSKWHVGRHVRMGIFAKRDILPGEELTFNYNVDRYGNDPQECYCGEPNCVGTLGGRTQTDVVTMSDLYIDALGIADEVAQLRATLPRGKRSKILDEDFHPTLFPMREEDSARVVTAVRQATSSRHILEKLLQRIAMTEEVGVHKACVKLHGFVVLAGVLDEWADDAEIVSLCLQCLAKWPLLARDKALDSGVDAQVRRFARKTSPTHALAQSLLDAWDKLETTFRIARRAQDVEEAANAHDAEPHTSWAERRRAEAEAEAAQRSSAAPNTVSKDLRALLAYRDGEAESAPRPALKPASKPAPPKTDTPAAVPSVSIDDIIRRANEENEAQQRRAAEERAQAAQALEAAEAEREQRAERHAAKRQQKAEQQAAAKRAKTERPHPDPGVLEKALAKQVGALVVKQLSKVKGQLDKARFKRHAKELTRTLCSKEMRRPTAWPPREGHVELSDEKRKKMKVFAHEYIKKLLRHQSEKARDRVGSTDPSADTPGDASAPDTSLADVSFADTSVAESEAPADTTMDATLEDVFDESPHDESP